MTDQLRLFDLAPPPEPLYTLRGYHTEYDQDPDRDCNSVLYSNLTRRDILRDYASPAEFDDWLRSGDRRSTAKACHGWSYIITRQTGRLYHDPVTRRWLATVPPFRWDPTTNSYRRCAPTDPRRQPTGNAHRTEYPAAPPAPRTPKPPSI